MNNRLIAVFFMILIICFGVFAVLSNAQQVEKEIAKNQAEQVKMEVELTNNELMDADSNVEEEYLDDQAKAQKDAELAQQQIDAEAESLLEQTKQEADQRRQAMEKEEQSHIKQAIQESEQQAAEVEEIDQMIESDLSTQD